MSKIDTVDAILTIESDNNATEADVIKAWASLIESGIVWELQGFYGRTATNLIENDIISYNGVILVNL